MLSRWIGRRAKYPAAAPAIDVRTPRPEDDPWFWSHFKTVADIVLAEVPRHCTLGGCRILDFGCGDGAASLGVALQVGAEVAGVDLARSFDHLPALAKKNLYLEQLPANLSFHEVLPDRPLPFADGFADLVYSWSVFEHVADARASLVEIARVTKPGGYLFTQIDPLFYSPYGSHLWRLVREPWAHLRLTNDELTALASAAPNDIPASEQDVLYRTNTFDDVKRYLLKEYSRLNRITADQLCELVSGAGFRLCNKKLTFADEQVPDELLAKGYSKEQLMTQQIVLLARRV